MTLMRLQKTKEVIAIREICGYQKKMQKTYLFKLNKLC